MTVRHSFRRSLWSRASQLFAGESIKNADGTEVVSDSKILVCGLGNELTWRLADADAGVYSRYYGNVHLIKTKRAREVMESLATGYDLVHLLVDIDSHGRLLGKEESTLDGALFLAACIEGDVKLLFAASNNEPQNYRKAFPDLRSVAMNLVMTIDRKGGSFCRFLDSLAKELSVGEFMPAAWAQLAPQAEGYWQVDLPECVFVAGRPGTKLLP